MLSQKFKVLNKLQVFHFRSRTVHKNTTQGRPQDLGGRAQFFFQILEFACREAMRIAREVRGRAPQRIFLKRCNLVRVIGCILIKFCLYFFQKLPFFYIKNQSFRCTHAMGYFS